MAVDPYASHIPILATVISHTAGPVLECGAGAYSTPLLHALCRGRELVTLETNATWATELMIFNCGRHRIVTPAKIEAAAELQRAWDVAFVDNGQFERKPCIEALASRARIIIVHDTERPDLYGYEPLLSEFAHRVDLLCRPWKVKTSIVSNFVILDWLKGLLP